MYILTISGYIHDPEQREFEQHFQQLLSLKPRSCEVFNLMRDTTNHSFYQFFSTWPTKETMQAFVGSAEYHRLTGAFKALGFIKQSFAGEVSGTRLLSDPSSGHGKKDDA